MTNDNEIRFSSNDYMNQLKLLIEDICIKNEKEAQKYESLESLKNYEVYSMARDGVDSFDDYTYTKQELSVLNFSTPEILDLYAANLDMLDDRQRLILLNNKRKLILSSFVETNNYYRKLNGLPNYNNKGSHIYIEKSPKIILKPDYSKPLHEQDTLVLDHLYELGIIRKLQMHYNTDAYGYLDFLGSRGISILKSRSANNLDLLRINTSVNPRLVLEFQKNYYINRNYIMITMFNNMYYQEYDYYPAFMSLFITMATIQSTILYLIENIISRDYVEDINYDIFLESHNLEFLNGLPIKYKKILVKNFNYLTNNKGSSKVLVDVCRLFGFEDVEFFKTYLHKKHRLDENGVPLFETTTDETGNEIPDYNYMYDLEFIDIPFDSDNMDGDLKVITNKNNYDEIADRDNYWGGGEITKENLKQELLKTDFKYILTKYVSLKSMFNITELNFETSYFFNMIFKLKKHISGMGIYLLKLTQKSLPIFDVIIYLYCLLMKKYNYDGEIITEVHSMLHVKGFNFNTDLGEIKQIILDLNLNIDLSTFTIKTLERDPLILTQLFTKNKQIRDYLVSKMYRCTDIYEYKKLKRIYDTLMHTQLNSDLYKKSNGEVASTYMDLLADINPFLYNRFLNKIDNENVTDEMNYVLHELEEAGNDGSFKFLFKNMDILDLDKIKVYLFKILNFFKSYTMQLRDFYMIYVIDDKYFNLIKVIDKLTVRVDTREYINVDVLSELKSLMSKFTVDELANVRDHVNISTGFLPNLHLDVFQQMLVYVYGLNKEFIDVKDLETHLLSFSKKEILFLRENLEFDVTTFNSEKVNLFDILNPVIFQTKEIDLELVLEICKLLSRSNYNELISSFDNVEILKTLSHEFKNEIVDDINFKVGRVRRIDLEQIIKLHRYISDITSNDMISIQDYLQTFIRREREDSLNLSYETERIVSSEETISITLTSKLEKLLTSSTVDEIISMQDSICEKSNISISQLDRLADLCLLSTVKDTRSDLKLEMTHRMNASTSVHEYLFNTISMVVKTTEYLKDFFVIEAIMSMVSNREFKEKLYLDYKHVPKASTNAKELCLLRDTIDISRSL